MSNHLGNVLTVITDNIGMSSDTTWATVVSASDYYPFGLTMEGRNYQDSLYRYGFNGKEKDDRGEWGSTNYDYGFRIYSPVIARFLSVDPLTSQYAELTPYQYASNKPINSIDLDGLESRTSIKGEFVDGMWTIGSDNHISLAHESDLRMQAEQSQRNKPFVPNYGTLRNNDITSTPQYKMFEYNVNTYGDFVLPIDVTKRLIRGEEVSSLELGMEAIALFPPFKVIGKGSKFIRNALKLSDNAFHSASGLTFKFGSKHGNRLSHVLEHTKNDLTKNFHGVFTVGDDLVKTLDEAYELAKKGGDNVIKSTENGRTSFIVDLGRNIGFEGGKKGSEKALNKINIIVEEGTDNVITAFPTQ